MSLREKALDLLFPPKCPFCQQILEDPRAPVCPGCQAGLPWLTGPAAARHVEGTAGCFSPLAYRLSVPEAVHRYKFSRVRAYGKPFALLMAQCVRDRLAGEELDALTWAPLSRERLRERGFDQARLLAGLVGAELSLPAVPLLQKVKDTAPQSELKEAAARKANAAGAYALLPGAEAAGKRLLLVDDVVTSGSTMAECARVLTGAGAEKVWGLTLAQARGDG